MAVLNGREHVNQGVSARRAESTLTSLPGRAQVAPTRRSRVHRSRSGSNRACRPCLAVRPNSPEAADSSAIACPTHDDRLSEPSTVRSFAKRRYAHIASPATSPLCCSPCQEQATQGGSLRGHDACCAQLESMPAASARSSPSMISMQNQRRKRPPTLQHGSAIAVRAHQPRSSDEKIGRSSRVFVAPAAAPV